MSKKKPTKRELAELQHASHETLLCLMFNSGLREPVLAIIGERARAAAVAQATRDLASIAEMPTWDRVRLVAEIRDDGPLASFARSEMRRRDLVVQAS